MNSQPIKGVWEIARERGVGEWVRSHLVALRGEEVMMHSGLLSEMVFLGRGVESELRVCEWKDRWGKSEEDSTSPPIC